MSVWLLVVNVGSTSVKTHLFDGDLRDIAVLTADYGRVDGVVIGGQDLQGQMVEEHCGPVGDVSAVLALVLDRWRQWLDAEAWVLAAIGHRIVHGADWFATLTPINPDVLQRLAGLDRYAPLHNPLNRLGVQMACRHFPEVAQFALFDTAFHRNIPEYAGRYAIPASLSSSVAFYRYGFHGISCQHSLTEAARYLACEPAKLNLIVLHLGGGASATAIRAGVGVDTSMGFSPTEGLMMASRSGDIDPMVLLTLQRQGMSVDELDAVLNHRSGLKAICDDTDMRRILLKAGQGDSDALLAIDMFCYRIKKTIGAYCAVLGEVSALVFTGGIGEHAAEIRQRIVTGLEPLGFSIDLVANARHEPDISGADSRSRILIIPAEEERVCARQILSFLDRRPSQISPD
ncbi:MAG: acetate/propionate family kinase [Methylovulum sp.]|uniref:acetate/propionate family kinase n=1 Tax=Methylovulum sp. TaxID=1916980 RepID=UPI002637AFC1|nr:acetate/propionate family kinase [Methylovulum sp.]MDD2724239.1 acetate/propionate family kinase [Methylovulum sp.]MDD5123028.1 acetate/propionate family kinase [Methylovulum sp.]